MALLPVPPGCSLHLRARFSEQFRLDTVPQPTACCGPSEGFPARGSGEGGRRSLPRVRADRAVQESREAPMFRILLAECAQEISSFNPVLSQYEDFELHRGADLIATNNAAETCICGALEVFQARQPGDRHQGATASPATGTIRLKPSNQRCAASPSPERLFVGPSSSVPPGHPGSEPSRERGCPGPVLCIPSASTASRPSLDCSPASALQMSLAFAPPHGSLAVCEHPGRGIRSQRPAGLQPWLGGRSHRALPPAAPGSLQRLA